MNENSDVQSNPDLISHSHAIAVSGQSAARWIKSFLACNPFYLVSAALLLYGFYLVSVDPGFLQREISQLFFNFTALQFYEILLVITALFLVRKQIWYDSTLLVGLENLLVLVPFILVSQAALIDLRWVWGMCFLAGIAAFVRSAALKRSFPQLNFPRRLTWIGIGVLLVNVILPVIYRILHEHKVGKLPTTGAAYVTNEFAWLLLLPAVCALATVAPAKVCQGELLPQRAWIPPGLFSLWISGTVVHLYCLGYVYDFALRLELVAPTIWVLTWTLVLRLKEFVPNIGLVWERTTLLLPFVATFIGISEPGNEVFLFLTILNVALYGGVWLHRGQQWSRHLLLISLVALLGGLPEDWGRNLLPEFSREKCLWASAALYVICLAVISPNPKMGLIGSLVSTIAVIAVWGNDPGALHWGMQIGFAFLLVHSLRWTDNQHEGTSAVRLLASLGWVAHTLWWMHDGGTAWMGCSIAATVLAVYLARRWFHGAWGSLIIPIAAGVVMVSGPGNSAASCLQSTPGGLLAIIGSFLLLALGTGAAVTKHRWLH